ncbi:MAG: efflux RND transporter periplasmic adaptor subunit [Bacteroidales bacterium]
MKRTILITGIIAVAAIIILIIIGRLSRSKDVANLYVSAKRGQFDIIVSTTGELEAENSQNIVGPDFRQSRNIRAMEIKITDLVPEGTEVKEGDYVATLDRTSFDNTLKDELERLTTYETNLEVKILDTAVTLSNLRDNIKNLRFAVEEAEITLQQSKYEPPTTIRQAEINLDKAKRSLDQSVKGYALRVEQARSEMRTIKNTLTEQRQRVAELQDVLSKFVITAPSDGMVIYRRDRTNTKRKVGSSISPWDNVVATLPDMSSMISKTYVNEIDVSKVKPGQPVEIMVDAFPDKHYTGLVSSVANIGEQLPNADAKVFEVIVKVNGTDPILRPSMTTGNKIITKTISDVIHIPLECVQTGSDSIPFVYLKNGTRQIVLLGESNENSVVIEQGLEGDESIFLSTPESPEKFKIAGDDLIEINRQRAKEKKEEEAKAREEASRGRQRPAPGMEGITPEMMQRFQERRGGMPGRGSGDSLAMRRMNVPAGSSQQGAPQTSASRQRQTGQPS